MLFVNVQKPDALFRKIGECEGNVSYLDGQGARRDLKGVAAQTARPSARRCARSASRRWKCWPTARGTRAETDELHDGEPLLKKRSAATVKRRGGGFSRFCYPFPIADERLPRPRG